MRNRCELHIELLVARDDLICRADWLWGQVGGASRGQAFRSTRLKEEKSSPSGCLLSFVAHALGGKNRPIRSSDVPMLMLIPMLMRANPEVSSLRLAQKSRWDET